MKLFIAEKPDLAKSIGAGIDGAYKSGDGYFEKGDNIITWAFGHILELAMPENYDEKYKSWNIEDLPLQIDKFKYIPIDSKKEQLKIICDLIKDGKISEIVNCGDADEEGQILIDEIIIYSQTKKPVSRLILQDLTEKGVRKSLKEIESNLNFQSMSEAGFARSQADWITGINLTRAYTKLAQNNGYKGVLSVGRVQTPILGLIVARDKEHENHKSSFYYTIKSDIYTQNTQILMTLKTDEKITDEKTANSIKEKTLNQSGMITKATNEKKQEFAPLPYSLLLLQADCASKFNYKPDKTLQITQSLREKYKLITYNRSDCQYLPENMFAESSDILNSIKATLNDDNYSNLVDNTNTAIKSATFNDEFITAHFAIIPTQQIANKSDLSKDELNVYELIAKRFIAQFYPPYEYIQTNIEANIKDNIFSASSRTPLKTGYKAVYKNDEIDIDEETSDEIDDKVDLTKIKTDEKADCVDINIDKKKTKPKPYYTMTALLKDLTQISKYVTDDKIKQLLKEKDKGKKGENGGIGTPATRSTHIKNLFDREYIKEEKKSIISTQKGRDLISLAPKILSTPDMTALWFEEQKDIVARTRTKDEFLKDVYMVVEKEIKTLKNNSNLAKFTAESQIDKTYPCKCGKGFLLRKKNQKGTYFWGCSNWQNGCKEMYSDAKGKPDIPKFFCPKCNKSLTRYKSKDGKGFYWGCSGYKDGCNLGFLQDKAGKPIIK